MRFVPGRGAVVRQTQSLLVLVVIGIGNCQTVHAQAPAPGKSDNLADAKKTAADLELLQGKWICVSHLIGRSPIPSIKEETIEVRGDRFMETVRITTAAVTIRTDRSVVPNRIELTADNPGGAPIVKRGVFRLDGDVLTICFVSKPDLPIPTDFTSGSGSQRSLWVWRRDAEPSKQRVDLDGIWIPVKIVMNGVEFPKISEHKRFVIGDQKLVMNDIWIHKGFLHLNASTTPKQIDFEDPEPAHEALRTSVGIYRLEGDTLTEAHDTKKNGRPANFDPGRSIVNRVFKRIGN